MQKQLDLSPEGTHSMHGLSRFHWFWPAMKTRKLRASKIECCTMVPSHFACRYPVARCRQMSPVRLEVKLLLHRVSVLGNETNSFAPSLAITPAPLKTWWQTCPMPTQNRTNSNKSPFLRGHHMELPVPCSVYIRAPHLLPFSISHVLVSDAAWSCAMISGHGLPSPDIA